MASMDSNKLNGKDVSMELMIFSFDEADEVEMQAPKDEPPLIDINDFIPAIAAGDVLIDIKSSENTPDRKMDHNGHLEKGDNSPALETGVFAIPYSNNNQVEEKFMSSDVLSGTVDKTEWDILVTCGTGSEPVSKWNRESLFQIFDPLVHESPVNVARVKEAQQKAVIEIHRKESANNSLDEQEDASNLNMQKALGEYEKTMSSHVEQNDELETNLTEGQEDVTMNEQIRQQHLENVEDAFSPIQQKMDISGHLEQGDNSPALETGVFAIPYSNNNQVEEKFMSSDVLSGTEDKTEWDLLVTCGTGSEPVSKWTRESVFQIFDPLVHTSPVCVSSDKEVKQNSEIEIQYNKSEPIPIPLNISNHNESSEYSDIEKHLNESETDSPPSNVSRDKEAEQNSEIELNLNESETNSRPTSVSSDKGTQPNSVIEIHHKTSETNSRPTSVSSDKGTQPHSVIETHHKVSETNSCPVKQDEQNASILNMQRVLGEYEKTMTSYVGQNDELKSKLAEAHEDIKLHKQCRDQALEDLKHVEDAFSLLHQKYERVKGTMENFRKNEDILKQRDEEMVVKLAHKEKKLEGLKEESQLRLEIMMKDYESKCSGLQSENLKLRAMIRKTEMAFETLGQNLEQKQKENMELNKLCEELIGGGLNVK